MLIWQSTLHYYIDLTPTVPSWVLKPGPLMISLEANANEARQCSGRLICGVLENVESSNNKLMYYFITDKSTLFIPSTHLQNGYLGYRQGCHHGCLTSNYIMAVV